MWRPAELAEKAADEVRGNASAAANAIPLDVEAVALGFGLSVVATSLFEEGRLYFPYGNPTILVNEDRPLVRQRFTIAHELGHWAVLQERFAQTAEAARAFRSEETLCNLFAGALLMPGTALAGRFRPPPSGASAGLPLVVNVARYFRVSLGAATVRLRVAFGWKRTLLQWRRINDRWLFEAESGVMPWEEGVLVPGDASEIIAAAQRMSPSVVVGAPLPVMAPGIAETVPAEIVVVGDSAAALVPPYTELKRRDQGIAA
jgi:Zn-dependent peptidase ImmA (M78 family)